MGSSITAHSSMLYETYLMIRTTRGINLRCSGGMSTCYSWYMHATLTALIDASETCGVKMVMLKKSCTTTAEYATLPLSQHSVQLAEPGRNMLLLNLLQIIPQSKHNGIVLKNILLRSHELIFSLDPCGIFLCKPHVIFVFALLSMSTLEPQSSLGRSNDSLFAFFCYTCAVTVAYSPLLLHCSPLVPNSRCCPPSSPPAAFTSMLDPQLWCLLMLLILGPSMSCCQTSAHVLTL